MAYQLPIVDVTVQPSLSAEQISALHGLVCFICGFRNQKEFFRHTNLVDNDIRSFKQGRLKFENDPNDPRLLQFYKAAYEWFRDHEIKQDTQLYVAVIPLLDTVYQRIGDGNANVLERAIDALYGLFRVTTGVTYDLAKSLEGVYYLFRIGDSEDDSPEFIVCAVRITLSEVGGVPRLVFVMTYRRRHTGRHHVEAVTLSVKGVVLPHGDNVSLAGFDEGSGNSPCLCMLYLPGRKEQEPEISGLMIRKNTVGRIVAARCLLVRAPQKQAPTTEEAWKQLFAEAKAKVAIGRCSSEEIEKLGINSIRFEGIMKRISNVIDNKTSYVLLDRLMRPPANVQGISRIETQPPTRDEQEYDMARLIPPPAREIIHDKCILIGDYLNIRYSPDQDLRLSYMRLDYSTTYANCLTFETIRHNKSGARIGKGLVYKIQSKWIADGIVAKHNSDFGMRRLTILHARQRLGKELGDMLGIRLTVAPDDKVASAHKIYCYKITDLTTVDSIKEQLKNPDNAKLKESSFKDAWPDVFEQINADLIASKPHFLYIEES